MIVRTILVTITIAAMGRAAILPIEETDFQLSASGNDIGNWTASVGDMEVNIEHKSDSNSDRHSNWTLTINRIIYNKDRNSASQTEEQKTATENRIPIIKDSWTELPRLPIKRKVPVDYLPIDFQTEIPVNDLLDKTDSDGFEMFDGVGWFKLDSRRLKFDEARLACEASSAHLAVPDTPEKLHVLGKLFERHSKVEYFEYEQVYVGLSDLDQDRIFTTVDGKVFNPSFPIWMEHELNNFYPGEYCVAFSKANRLNDVPCYIEMAFFCEKEDQASDRRPFD